MNGIRFMEMVGELEFPDQSSRGWNTWQRNSRNLASALLANRKPEEFLREASVIATMFVGKGAAFTDKQLEYLKTMYSPLDLSDLLAENDFGSPELMDGPWQITSGNLINQLYHLSMWMDTTRSSVSKLESITEVGGGYGAMCMLAYRSGFSGLYTLLDLPMQSLLQEYYLSNVPGKHQERVVFATNSKLVKRPCDLLIALDSLGEIPLNIRNEMMDGVQAGSYLFHYIDSFDGADNVKWFRDFSARTTGIEWSEIVNKNLPGSRYMIGHE